MEPTIYFNKESPDFNFGLCGDPKKIAANRVVLCILTEYGLCNNRKMRPHEYSAFVESVQTTTGIFKEVKLRIKPKTQYSKRRSVKPIKTIDLTTLREHTTESIPIEDTS